MPLMTPEGSVMISDEDRISAIEKRLHAIEEQIVTSIGGEFDWRRERSHRYPLVDKE